MAGKPQGSNVSSSPDSKKKKAGVLGLFRGGTKSKSPPKKTNKGASTMVDDQTTVMTTPSTTTTTSTIPAVPQQPGSRASTAPTLTKASLEPPVANKASWFCRTRYFRQMCDAAFDGVDLDGSGAVDEKELYSGLLLIHLKLGCYAGPAACRPLSRERAKRVFERYDTDNSGCLNREEFRSVMTVLFGNVFFRVLVQWSMTLMFVPMVAQMLLDGLEYIWVQLWNGITNLDEHSSIANTIELTIEEASKMIMHQLHLHWLVPYVDKLNSYLEMIPESVWEAIPLAIISTTLGMVVVPWTIFQVDDFFQRVAEKDPVTKVKRA